MEFLTVDSLEDARSKLYNSAKDWMAASENIALERACGRILSGDVLAPDDIPPFRRSAMDGYAVISADTSAAGEGIPTLLRLKGIVEIGKPAAIHIKSGECCEVPTGGMLPAGADAVVMAEYAELFSAGGVALYAAAANGENVVKTGEDAAAGAVLLRRGKYLLPQDIGALAAAGYTSVPAYISPRLYIISTGDELVPPAAEPDLGQVRDINTHALTALAQKNGFNVVGTNVLPDCGRALESAVKLAMEASDIVAVSGGSSKGPKDITKTVFGNVCAPGVYTHGVALKPGKPVILAYDSPSRTALIGLPGHPVSAMTAFELLICWLYREITGCKSAPAIPARVSCNVPSSPGKLTCWPAALTWDGGGYVAEPIFGKSGLITALTKADGYFCIERDKEGLAAGQTVLVHLF
jgi:molybdopterin molybdotransferase